MLESRFITEPTNIDQPKLQHEQSVYKALGKAPGIPQVLWFGVEHGYTTMVTCLLSPSIIHLHSAFDYRLGMNTVLLLAIQLVYIQSHIYQLNLQC